MRKTKWILAGLGVASAVVLAAGIVPHARDKAPDTPPTEGGRTPGHPPLSPAASTAGGLATIEGTAFNFQLHIRAEEPEFDPSKSDPPLKIRAAIAAARKELSTHTSSLVHWQCEQITMSRAFPKKDVWYYVVQFKCAQVKSSDFAAIPVSMSGKVASAVSLKQTAPTQKE